MKKLENWFHRGSGNTKIFYSLEKRTEKVGLFKLFIEIEPNEFEPVGWEIARIFVHREREMFGRMIEASEGLPSDEQFGMGEMTDKAMFPNEEQKAIDYFKELDAWLNRPKEVVHIAE